MMRWALPLLAALACGQSPASPPPTGQYAVTVVGATHESWSAYDCTFALAIGSPGLVDSVTVAAGQQAGFTLTGEQRTYPAIATLRWTGQPGSWTLQGAGADTVAVTIPGDTTVLCP